MRAVRPTAAGEPAVLKAEHVPVPRPGSGEALVRVSAAAVNRSDTLACRGVLPGPFPRVLGRDYVGVVVDGPSAWLGRRVWGTGGGDLGIARDGSHARFLTVPVGALTAAPDSLTDVEAAASGLAYFTAAVALARAGGATAGDMVVATGAAGGVGSAVAHLVAWRGGFPVAVVRDADEETAARAAGLDVVIRSDGADVVAEVLAATGGAGARLAVDAVGGPLTPVVLACLSIGGGLCLISSPLGATGIDLLDLYRRDLRLVGLNTSRLTTADAATALHALADGFACGALPPAPVHAVYRLDQAGLAYTAVERGVAGRPILVMDDD